MTFLELCQRVATESGTVPGANPITSVVGQTGRPGRIVAWVQQALTDIENHRGDWAWMLRAFNRQITSGDATYSATDLGITDWAEWMTEPDYGHSYRWFVYSDTVNFSDETLLDAKRPDEVNIVGSQRVATGRPTWFTMQAALDVVRLYPIPDAAYWMRGRYRRTPQTLTAGDDVPQMPARYHDVIWRRALIYLLIHDEAFEQVGPLEQMYQVSLSKMERDQVGQLRLATAFA